MPTYYNKTLAVIDKNELNYWEPVRYQPNLVIVMLGSNDYSTEPNPTDNEFITGLTNFLDLIHSDYKDAKVLAMCAPSAHGKFSNYITFI